MKIPDSIVDAQVERLLDVVKTYHQDYCEDVTSKAKIDASNIKKQAHRVARKRMHQIVAETREKFQQKIGASRAKQQTREKQHQYRHDQQLLMVAQKKLEELLVSRWQVAEQRQSWIDHIMNLSSRVLQADVWQVEHPADWTAHEQKQLAESIYKQTGEAPTLKASQEIDAGIRIISNGSTVDGTLSGVLIDQYRIEAEFLSQYKDFQLKSIKLLAVDKLKANTSE